MMGLFMTAMAVVMLLSGAGIDRINERKAKIQQAQPAQITYVSESAGTSNEPVLTAVSKNDVTAPAAGINNELAQADEKNEPDVHESMPVYAPAVDEPTPEVIPEVDVDKQKDELAQEEKEEKPAEPAQAEVPDLTADMVYNCNDACRQVAVLNGIDSAEALCGAYGVEEPFSVSYTYEKCAKPEIVDGVTAEATKIIGDSTAPLDKKVFYDVNSRETVCESDVNTLLNDILVSRAMEHGLDMNFARTELSQDRCFSTEKESIGPARVSLRLATFGQALEHALFNVKRVINVGAESWNNRRDCEWLTGLFDAKPFCEANKDFPDCKQFLDIYGNCEKILADAANKNEL